ncbi:MAG: hypothetical protein J07HB67_02216 [halophilic archaeon J07HB67]|nr:MAG: hypothetical protein J07HB67_02216 [halophilic archaeon J07HB67]
MNDVELSTFVDHLRTERDQKSEDPYFVPVQNH